nr:hypothetical protein [Streptococcus equi]
MANPPFNLKDWRGEKELLNDARWKDIKSHLLQMPTMLGFCTCYRN